MPQFSDYPRFAWQLLGGERSTGELAQHQRCRQDLQPYLDLGQPRDILDIANGRLRPQYAILRGTGHRVIGVDFVNRPAHSHIDTAYALARRVYAARLGLPVTAIAADRLLVSDVGRLPFPAHSFDLATSAAAFEHFLDMPAVISEIHRVLRPGGMLWISIHLFSSPSGGHNVNFTEYPLQTLRPGYEPWDHLRQRRLPFTVPLNEWRKQQYLDAFATHFEILTSYCATREGEHWLTPAIQHELADYTEDELTCAALVVIAQKQG